MDDTEVQPNLIIDRLTACYTFNDPSDAVSAEALLKSDNINKEYPGLTMKLGHRYRVQAAIRLPFDTTEPNSAVATFEVGPKVPNFPSCRLDFNPAKLPAAAWDDLSIFILNSTALPLDEFFNGSKVTRIDLAVDLPDLSLEDVIVQTNKKRKVGIYSDQLGSPQTAYLGTGKNRVVAYNKPDKASGSVSLRIECRKNPQCLGHELYALANPFSAVALYPMSVLSGLNFGVPPTFFADSVRLRGLKRALKLLKPACRALIEAKLHTSEGLLPDATAIWKQYPPRLKAMGLQLPPHAING